MAMDDHRHRMTRIRRSTVMRLLASTLLAASAATLFLAASGNASGSLGTVGTATPSDPTSQTALGTTNPLASTQQFGLQLSATSGQTVAVCTGSTTSNSTEVNTYLVPVATNPSTLTFGTTGVTGTGNNSLYEVSKSKIINLNTSTAGQVLAIPTDIVFGGVLPASIVLPGGATTTQWNAGIACVAPPSGASSGLSTVTDYWNTVLTFTSSTSDPNHYVWTYSTS